MGLIHAYLPEIAIVGIENGDLVELLDDLDADVPKYVLVPFLFGFSTTLVLAIFNRIIAGISSLFGISGETTTRGE
jgi:hypothetical protein